MHTTASKDYTDQLIPYVEPANVDNLEAKKSPQS